MKKEVIKIDYPLKVPKFTRAHIEYLIHSRAEESIHIEFKAAGALEFTDSKKKEIAKDVSAMANSDGGVIIYGLSEIDHVAKEFSFVDGNVFSKEWLEQVINSKIKRRIPEINIDVIRIGNKIAQSLYVVRIPRSSEAPHMASDGRYYKRFNFESVFMNEYEVRDLFRRVEETQLKLLPVEFSCEVLEKSKQGIELLKLSIVLDVKNTSRAIESVYKTIVRLPIGLYNLNIEYTELNQFFRKYQKDIALFNIPASTPLFPQEVNTLVAFDLKVSKDVLTELSKHPFKIRFYYSNGIYESQYFLDTKLKIDGKVIREGDFK
ncbi:MAG: hypothetical protein ACI9RU_003123 [Litorivivens sp.]